MKRTKLSGYQNRKRKAERQAEDKRSSESLRSFFQISSVEQQVPHPDDIHCCSIKELNFGQHSADRTDASAEEKNQLQEETDDTHCSKKYVSDPVHNFTQTTSQDERYQEIRAFSSSTEIDLTDPANWPGIITSSFIDTILMIGVQSLEKKDFPVDDKGRKFSAKHFIRKLSNGEEMKRRWMIYSNKMNRIFCLCCKLFPATQSSYTIPSQLGTTGYDDWKHLADRLKEHETSRNHSLSYCTWVEAEKRLKINKGVDGMHETMISREVEHWKAVLERLMAIILYLSKHNLAFRGSSDKPFTANNGNFLGLVELFGQFDNTMREHLRRIQDGCIADHYLGKNVQNEIISLMANEVLLDIRQRATQSKYFSIILDCTPDVSRSEKLSMIIRFVDFSNNEISVKEHFLGFKEVNDTTGKGLTELLLETLQENNLDFNNLRGQGYDNGSNMKGKNEGVQARVLRQNPRAFYVPCGCHSLNLVVSDAASVSIEAITLFGVLQRIYVLFSASTQRWSVLLKHVPTLTVKPVCTTRWESRIDTVKAICTQTTQIYDSLMEIYDNNPSIDAGVKHEAYCLAEQLCDFKFLVGLHVWYDILYTVNNISKRMQNADCDLIAATAMIEGAVKFIKAFRDNGYDEAKLKATKSAESLSAEPIFRETRRRKRTKMFDHKAEDEPMETSEEKFKIDFFFVTVDKVLSSLNERFEQILNFTKLWGFLFNLKCLPENLEAHCMDLHHALSDQDSSDINSVELAQELKHFKFVMPCTTKCVTPREALQFLLEMKMQDNFPNIWIALRILLTVPVTVASAERSFSKLKLIKNYLRSTMTDDRLSSLAVLAIENRISQNIDLSKAVTTFAQVKARKVKLY